MLNTASTFIVDYMNDLPDDVKSNIRWNDIKLKSEKIEYNDTHTIAVLKIYSYLKYWESTQKNVYDKIYKAVEKEFEGQNISLENNETEMLKVYVKEIIIELMNSDNQLGGEIKSSKILILIRLNVDKLKQIPKYGDVYYRILNLSYLENDFNLNIEEILQKLGISRTHYYRMRNQAISELSNILWGDV